jgi:hypothetical protein
VEVVAVAAVAHDRDVRAVVQAVALAWGGNAVSGCRFCSRAKGPGTGARAFPRWRVPYLEKVPGVLDGVRTLGVLWDPRDPLRWPSSPQTLAEDGVEHRLEPRRGR